MLIKAKKFEANPISPSEITPEAVYRNRRQFLKMAGVLSVGAVLAACAQTERGNTSGKPAPVGTSAPTVAPEAKSATDELGDPLNTYEEITNYNNFYEFGATKDGPAIESKDFKTTPWDVEVYGLVNNPKTYAVEDLIKKFAQEERIYRLRCVEGWSMVIPWTGFSLASLLKEVDPQSSARFVRFETLLDKEQMPGQRSPFYPWPYQEGLRLDEAMHDLTILATGLYGKSLPPQDGAPIRLVVPWKYGFKSIKSIVKIELVDTMPETMWSTIAPNEYGFYANVNPKVNHPRWSQASEMRIGQRGRRPTLMFNGYEEEVAGLYAGMDLVKNY